MESLYLLFTFDDNFSGYGNLVGCFLLWFCFSLNTLLISLQSVLSCMVFHEKSVVILIIVPQWVRYFLLWLLSRLYFLYLIFWSLNMIWKSVDLGVFILLSVFQASWICGFISVINVGKFSAITTSNISSVIFSPYSPSGIPLICMVYLLWLFHSSWIVCSFSFFPLFDSALKAFIEISSS